METPVMLWLNVGVSGDLEPPPPLLAEFCTIRRTNSFELSEPAASGMRAHVLCFNYDYPDLPGLQLLARTKRRYPSVPVLMLTLHHSEELAVWAFRTQVFDYLIKPLRKHEVESCMRRLRAVLDARGRQQPRVSPQDVRPVLPREVRYAALTPEQQLLQPALIYIERHFADTVRQDSVAEACGLSPYRFGRAFKNTFGKSFQDYLIDYRISAAKRLLGNPGIAVIDVGLSTGFPDPSYFARIFRRRVGVSPTDFRRSLASETAQAVRQLPLPEVPPADESASAPRLQL